MNQGLQRPALLRPGGRERGVSREQPREKMMLVGESGQPQSAFFGLLDQAGPLDMRRQVALPDLFQDGRQDPMIGITLERSGAPARRVKLAPRQAVIGRQDHAALQLARQRFDPIERREIDLGFVANLRQRRELR